MDALVIGCGYLGSRVAALWRAEGRRVFVTTRRVAAAEDLRTRGFEPILCDVTRPETIQLPPVDVIAYAVALDRTSGLSMRDVYVGGLANVLARLPKAGRFVYVSSSSIYGQTDGAWIDEDAPTEPAEPAGLIVLEAEGVLRAERSDAILLRFSGIYGPGRWLRRKSIEAGEPIVGDADKWLNLIHVDDGAAAVLAAGKHGVPGRVYNVCDNEPVRRRDFYRAMATALHAPAPTFAPPISDAPLPPHESANRRLSNRRLREELRVNFRYPSYREGLTAAGEPGALATGGTVFPLKGQDSSSR
jgi:nucleoside-diphosphate-sugar epimerase